MVKDQNSFIGDHFFSSWSMRFFSSQVHSTYLKADKYFITSEKSGFEDYARVFSVRLADPKGRIETVVRDLESEEAAESEIRSLLREAKSLRLKNLYQNQMEIKQ